jgi:hypothetical protein
MVLTMDKTLSIVLSRAKDNVLCPGKDIVHYKPSVQQPSTALSCSWIVTPAAPSPPLLQNVALGHLLPTLLQHAGITTIQQQQVHMSASGMT